MSREFELSFVLVLNPSAVCNNRCAACAMQAVYGKKTLSFGAIRKLIEELCHVPEERGFGEIMIAGGEPLLYPRLGDLLCLLADKGFSTTLFTSGSQDKDKLSILSKTPPRRITLSLDSADPRVHDGARGRRGSFDDATAALRFVRDAIPQTDLSAMTVVTRETINHLPGLIRFLSEEGVERASFQLVMDVAGVSSESLRPLESELEEFYLRRLPALLRHAHRAGLWLRMLPNYSDIVFKNTCSSHIQTPGDVAHLMTEGDKDWKVRQARRDEIQRWARGEYNTSTLARTGGECPLKGHITVNPDGSIFPCSQATIYHPKWAVGNISHIAGFSSSASASSGSHCYIERLLNDKRVLQFLSEADSREPCRRCVAMSNMSLVSGGTGRMAKGSSQKSETAGRKGREVPFTLLTEMNLFTSFGAYLPPSLPGLGSGILAGALKERGYPFALVDLFPLYIDSACTRETAETVAAVIRDLSEHRQSLERGMPIISEVLSRGGESALVSYFERLKLGLKETRAIVSRDRLVFMAKLLKEFFNFNLQRISSGRGDDLPFIKALLKRVQTKWAGVSVADPREPVTRQIMKSLKRAGHSIIVGGPATFYLESEPVREAFESLGADGWIVRGYGEESLVALLETLECPTEINKIREDSPRIVSLSGLSGWKEHEKSISINRTSTQVRGLVRLKAHRREFKGSKCTSVSPVRSDFSRHDLSGYLAPVLLFPISMVRGCYWKKCAFCRHSIKRCETVDMPVDEVVDAMIHHRKTLGAKYFTLNDESLHPAKALSLARMIRKKSILKDIRFAAAARPEAAFDKHTLSELAEAGLSTVYWGVESGHIDTLRRMGKGTDPETIRQVLQCAAEVGISNLAFYMLGFPGETEAQAEATLEFMRETRDFVDAKRVNRFVLQDGTPIYENPERYSIKNIKPDPHQPGLFTFDDPQGMHPALLEKFLVKARSPELVSGALIPLAGGGDGEELLPLYFLQRCMQVRLLSPLDVDADFAKGDSLGSGDVPRKCLLSRGVLSKRPVGDSSEQFLEPVLVEGEALLPVSQTEIPIIRAMDGTHTLEDLRREFPDETVEALVRKMIQGNLIVECVNV